MKPRLRKLDVRHQHLVELRAARSNQHHHVWRRPHEAKLIQMIGPERLEHTAPGGGAIQHEHKHTHVVINPRDMTPKQRTQLKAVLLSIERSQDDEEADDSGDHQVG